jgi:hypothetical protein
MQYFTISTSDKSIITLVRFIPDLEYIDMYNKDYQEYEYLLDSEDNIVVEMTLTILKDKYKNTKLKNEI